MYDGYVASDGGQLLGTLQVKVAKAGRDGLAKVTASFLPSDGSGKVAFRGGLADAGGAVTEMSAGGRTLRLTLGVDGLGGTLDGQAAVGARSVFAGRTPADKSAAADVLGAWAGTVNVVAPDVALSVNVAAKGKVKVAGAAGGAQVSASAQLIAGDAWCAVPVVVSRKARLAFTLWLPRAGGAVTVEGLPDAVAGRSGALAGDARFRMDAAALAAVLPGLLAGQLPDGLAVTGGAKWSVAKPGRVVFAKGTQEVDAEKAGENPAGLRLTWRARAGSFKGSFKAYAVEDGRIRAYAVNVAGVLVDGVGYGTATLKKPACTFPVTVR